MLSLIEPNDVLVAHVSQQSVMTADAVDDRKFIEFTLAEEFERANQIVVRAEKDGTPVDEVIRQHERAEMVEVFPVARSEERADL